VEPQLAVLDACIGVLEVGATGSNRLDLRARQHDPALERVENVVVVASAAIPDDYGVGGATHEPTV
jgi:hypothetical protein